MGYYIDLCLSDKSKFKGKEEMMKIFCEHGGVREENTVVNDTRRGRVWMEPIGHFIRFFDEVYNYPFEPNLFCFADIRLSWGEGIESYKLLYNYFLPLSKKLDFCIYDSAKKLIVNSETIGQATDAKSIKIGKTLFGGVNIDDENNE